MKRWNQKGTVHAKRRMAELRDRKRDVFKQSLIAKWQLLTGRRDWWTESGLPYGCGREASIAWLTAEIEAFPNDGYPRAMYSSGEVRFQ